MWIKLLSPHVSLRPMDSGFKRHMAPPLALLVLGALTPERHRVTMEDENVERLRLDDGPDLVGITVKADTADRSFAIAANYRRRGIPVIMGGIHVTACPEACRPHADAIVIGEAEELWPGIVSDAESGSLKPIYRHEGPADQALSPVPRWSMLKGKNYLYTNTLCIGRGCPWRCDFCYSSSPNVESGYRMKPLDHIIRDIQSLGTDHVMFIDDNFIGDPASAKRLITRLQPLGLTWHTAVSADIGRHDDILDLMASSGCRSLFIGFETLNADNLVSCRKRQNRIEEYERTIQKIHDRGMLVNASVVFGFDGDGPDVFDRTVDWLIANRVETMTAHLLTPYPGTVLYDRLVQENRIIDFDLTHYNTSRAVFTPALMSTHELESGLQRSYDRFYAPSSIFARLPADRRQWVAFLLFSFGYRRYGKVLSLLGKPRLMRPLAKLARRLSYPRAGQSRRVIIAPAAESAKEALVQS